MLAKTLSAAIRGLDVSAVEVEVDFYRKQETNEGQYSTTINIGGLPDTAIRESRDRIWSALAQCSAFIPSSRITINLAPADLRKSGTAFDLPIALCLLKLLGKLPEQAHFERTLIIGELALDGAVRPIRGALSIAMAAREMKLPRIIVPAANAREAAMAEGIDVYGARSLADAIDIIAKPGTRLPQPSEANLMFTLPTLDDAPDFIDVKGQESAKRAIVTAAAGSHNLLLIGNPGCGKTLMARRIPGILPPLTLPEALDVTKIHSIAGVLDPRRGLVTQRPFRSPHHTISDGGLVGGSATPRPGELSLAHNGVLFLDELPEFRRSTLEVLRQPLESGEVTLARASGTFTFPAKVMLVAAMNPCPCGYYGSRIRQCTCSYFQILNYRSRLSGPLIDRLDMHIEIASITHEQLLGKRNGMSSETMRELVLKARDIQYQRFKGTNIRCNADMAGRLLDEACHLGPDEQDLLKQIVTDLKLSARAFDRILKVARTLADLDGQPDIKACNLQEAATYRFLDRQNQ